MRSTMIRLLLVCLLILKIISHPAYFLFKEFVILSSYYFECPRAHWLRRTRKLGSPLLAAKSFNSHLLTD